MVIYCGIKIGLSDYTSKIKSGADFFEILFDSNNRPSDYCKMIEQIKTLKKPFFFHLSTSYTKNRDEYLLNIASQNIDIKRESRSILEREIKALSRYKPSGFIVHSPTKFDFSRNRKIFGKKDRIKNYSESFKWLNDFAKDIYVENSPEAINIGNKNYFTEPINNISCSKYGLKCLLDTGHFYTTCLVKKKIFSNEVHPSFLKRFSYFHISTLKNKSSDDSHGSVFLPLTKNFPSSKQLEKLILRIPNNKSDSDCYIVCEPSGKNEIHLDNFKKLVKLFPTR